MYTKFNESSNEFLKGWYTGYDIFNKTNIKSLPDINIDIPNNSLIKYDIYKLMLDLPLEGNPLGIQLTYFNHQNIPYATRSKKNHRLKKYFPSSQIINV